MAEQHRATAEQWKGVKEHNTLACACLLELRDRIEALEARNEDDKEAWAARLRRPGRSQGERINSLVKLIESLVKRIEALEAPKSGSIDLSHLSDAEREKMAKWIANPGTFEVLEVAQPAKPNHPAKPDSSLVERVAAAITGDSDNWKPEARAAIREVAAWLRDRGGYPWAWAAQTMEREAER